MSKSIFEKQNDSFLIKCLCAQRKGYSSLKKINNIRIGLSLLLATVFSFIVFFCSNEQIGAWITLFNLGIIFLDKYLDGYIGLKQEENAKIQQYFDFSCFNEVATKELVSLQSIFVKSKISELLSGKDFKEKEILSVKNWYEDYSSEESQKQIFYCQKENIRWSTKNNRRLFFVNIGFFILILFAIVGIGIFKNLSLVKWIGIISCLLTYFDFFLDANISLNSDYKKIKEINSKSDLIEISLSECNNDLYDDIIELQNMIFEYRAECVLIPDFFYSFFKTKDENKENRIAEQLRNDE